MDNGMWRIREMKQRVKRDEICRKKDGNKKYNAK